MTVKRKAIILYAALLAAGLGASSAVVAGSADSTGRPLQGACTPGAACPAAGGTSAAWSPYARGPVIMAGRQTETLAGGPSSLQGRTSPRTAGIPFRPALGASGAARTSKALVILAEYDDERFFYGASSFKKMLTESGYSIEGAVGSAKDYLKDQTGRDFDITVAGPVRVSKERKYYGIDADGKIDEHHGEFIAEACTLAADSCGVKFSQFDADGDGFVDQVFVFFAGEDQAQQNGVNSDYMWSHASTLEASDYGKPLEVDGVKVNSYACSSELFLRGDGTPAKMAPIGTFCHEYSHCLGLMDMYDTDYELSGGTAAALWRRTSLMDGGNYNNHGNTPPNWNAIERECAGVQTPQPLKSGSYTIHPLGTEGAMTYRISNPADTAEYYLVECRSTKSKWDSHAGGDGLLVYHIDKSPKYKTFSEVYKTDFTSDLRWSIYNEVNCRPDHQCADLVEADQRSDKDPAPDKFSDISGIFFPQSTASAIGGDAAIKLPFLDGTSSSLMLSSILLNGDGTVSFKVSDLNSPVPPEPVDTLKNDDPLYIIAIYSAKPEGGAVPKGTSVSLRVSNSVEAEKVEWFFGSAAIADPGHFIPQASGTVRAEITWSSSGRGTDYIFKDIRVQ